jgi:hypothetical protein
VAVVAAAAAAATTTTTTTNKSVCVISIRYKPRNQLQSISLPDRTYTHKWRYRQTEIKIK